MREWRLKRPGEKDRVTMLFNYRAITPPGWTNVPMHTARLVTILANKRRAAN